ncbi:glycosyltransferase [Shimia abyssi]|uniref:UDP-N-acetylglucosamine transferase subunit ALG13 n=1 Tax=Shimia abyssi TaxID=1662395 RepID=A0A2P8FJT4_9RHOB|nr:glycosyltransferase [Shimia abyssi]PSL21975.1 UDP-N-acetylglucosamine transferase subunit ALG13 [Shimia abyssi]
MIFATVGTQLPFDRLLTNLDSWAARNPNMHVFAQCGLSTAKVPHIKTTPTLSQSAFRHHFASASLIVAHAGMGTILTAAELGKPVILMPRRAALNEHRNDHQSDTAREMAKLSNVMIAEDEAALHAALNTAMSQRLCTQSPKHETHPAQLEGLIDVVRDFVWAVPSKEAPVQFHKGAVST